MKEQEILQIIGQLEASTTKFEQSDTTEEDFQDYCDNLYSCVSYWRQELRKVRKNEKT